MGPLGCLRKEHILDYEQFQGLEPILHQSPRESNEGILPHDE